MKSPLLCPLAQSEPPLLENLTAEQARNCVKIFGELPYSPADAELAALVAREISEKSRLGFGQVKIKHEIPEKMAEFLRANGFRITPCYLTIVVYPSSGLIHTETHSMIQWSDTANEPAIPNGWFLSKEESIEDTQKYLDQYRKDQEETNKRLEESLGKWRDIQRSWERPDTSRFGILVALLVLVFIIYFLTL